GAADRRQELSPGRRRRRGTGAVAALRSGGRHSGRHRGSTTRRTRQNAVFGALQRAKPFIEENAAQLTSVVDLTSVRRRLDDVIARFTTHAFDQNVNDRDVKGESAKQRQLRLTLSTDVMRPVAEVARRNLRTVP